MILPTQILCNCIGVFAVVEWRMWDGEREGRGAVRIKGVK